jgi:superfamily I DNA and RNA helicase
LFSEKEISVSDQKSYRIAALLKNTGPEEFKRRLLHSNRLEKFLTPKIRNSAKTSEERNIEHNCTFKPNLNATRKMNAIPESKINLQSSQSHVNLNQTPNMIFNKRLKSLMSSREAQIGSLTTRPGSQNYKSKMSTRRNNRVQKYKTVVLNLNIDQSKVFDVFMNNGYTQRSIERYVF